MNHFICIFRTLDIFQAHLIKSYFDNEGIDCVLKTNDASGVLSYLSFTQGGIEVMIPKKDLEIGKKNITKFTKQIKGLAFLKSWYAIALKCLLR